MRIPGNHPNIVTVFQIGESDGDSYLAMEFVEGESLRCRIGASHDMSEALASSEQIVDGQVRFTYKNYRAVAVVTPRERSSNGCSGTRTPQAHSYAVHVRRKLDVPSSRS